MASTEKVFLPIHPPPTTYKDDPRAVLSQSEQSMYSEVLTHFTRTDPVYTIPNIEKGELMDDEKFWLSRDCLLRYLRASKWKVPAAIQRLESTLKWRREYGLYDTLNANLVEPEAVTGKEILYGYDVTGKPAFYMIPSRQNTDEATRQIQFAVWMLERCVDLMEPGVENLALLINFGDRGKNPSVSTALSVLHILQNHYPERLGLALIINVPFLVNAFFKLVMPLVDPITRQKVKFNPKLFEDGFFEKDMVMKEWGGSQNFEYEHEKYWPDLTDTCEKHVKTWMENWRKLGAKVGVSEWDYKTGTGSTSTEAVQESKEEKKAEQTSVTVAPEPAVAPQVQSVESQPVEPVVALKEEPVPAPAAEKAEDPSAAIKQEGDASATHVATSSESQGAGDSVTAVIEVGAVSGGAVDVDAAEGAAEVDGGAGSGGDGVE